MPRDVYIMVFGREVDLETPQHISELNSAITSSRLANPIALFISEMCGGSPKLKPKAEKRLSQFLRGEKKQLLRTNVLKYLPIYG